MRTRLRVKWAQIRVACMSFVGLLILGVVLYLLTGGMLFTEKATLYLYVPDATGISIDSPVRVDGITVGKVTAIGLSGSKELNRVVRLTLTVQRHDLDMIPVGSYAELGTDDPVGDKFVDVTSAGRVPMGPNTEIPYKPDTDLFKTLDFAQFDASLRQMDAILTDIETGKGLVGQFVMGTQMYSDVRRRFADIEKSVRIAADTTGAFGQELYSDRLYRQFMTPLVELDQALARLQSGQGAGGRLLQDTAQYEQAIGAVRDFRQTIATLRTSAFVQSDGMHTDLNRWVVALTRSVDEINSGPLFAAPQQYESLTGFAKELTNTLKDFQGNPKKYLRVKMF